MKSNTSYGERKYHILQKIETLPLSESRIAKKKLPIALGVSPRTFQRWLYATKEDKIQIPCGKLAIMGSFFSCTMEELLNFTIPKHSISTLRRIRQFKPSTLKTLGLTK